MLPQALQAQAYAGGEQQRNPAVERNFGGVAAGATGLGPPAARLGPRGGRKGEEQGRAANESTSSAGAENQVLFHVGKD